MLSRLADSVYWLGRYVERAGNLARAAEATAQANLDLPEDRPEQWEPLVAASGDLPAFHERYGAGLEPPARRKEAVLRFLTFDPHAPNSVVACVGKARENARAARGSVSPEAWEQLNRLYLSLGAPEARTRALEAPAEFFAEVRQACNLFWGIIEATQSRGEEWRFLELGRHLERADQVTRLLDVKYFILLPDPADVGSVVDDLLWTALLHSVSGYEMFRRRHGRIAPEKVVDFLLLDREFPRSALYCLLRAEEALLAASGTPPGSFRNAAERALGSLRAELTYARAGEILAGGLHEFLDGFQAKLNRAGEAVSGTFFALEPAHDGQIQQ